MNSDGIILTDLSLVDDFGHPPDWGAFKYVARCIGRLFATFAFSTGFITSQRRARSAIRNLRRAAEAVFRQRGFLEDSSSDSLDGGPPFRPGVP